MIEGTRIWESRTDVSSEVIFYQKVSKTILHFPLLQEVCAIPGLAMETIFLHRTCENVHEILRHFQLI